MFFSLVELQYDAIVKSQQERVDVAMTREWDKWNEFGVTKFLSKRQLNDIMKRNTNKKIVGNRWVFTEKVNPGQARLQGPVGRAGVSRRQCLRNVFDAQSAYLQSDGIERLLLFRMPHKNPPPGTKPGQVFVASGSICGTRDAGRAWYEHSKNVLEAGGFVKSRPEQGLYYLHGPSGLEAVAHTHAGDFLVAFKKASKRYQDALQHLVQELQLKQQSGTVVYCGRTMSRGGNHIKVTQAKSTMSLECISIDLASRTLESALASAKITGYRSMLGQLLWLGQQSRPDLRVGVSLAAQKLSGATLSDVKALNKLVEQAKSTGEIGIVIPCGVVNLVPVCQLVEAYVSGGEAKPNWNSVRWFVSGMVPLSMKSLALRKTKEGVETEHLRLCTIKIVPVFEDGEWETPAAPHMPATKPKSKGKGKEERGPRQLAAASAES